MLEKKQRHFENPCTIPNKTTWTDFSFLTPFPLNSQFNISNSKILKNSQFFMFEAELKKN